MHGTCRKACASAESQPSYSDAKTQLTDFSQIPQILRARFRCMTSFSSPDIWDFYFDIFEWHNLPRAREHLRPCLHLTNLCTEPKGSQPN